MKVNYVTITPVEWWSWNDINDIERVTYYVNGIYGLRCHPWTFTEVFTIVVF